MAYQMLGRSFVVLCLVVAGCEGEVPVLSRDGGGDAGSTHDAGMGDGGLDAGASVPDPSTCVGFAELYCRWLAECVPFGFQHVHHGLLSDCIAQRAARCEYERGLPDAGDIVDRAACIAVTTASCALPVVAPACATEPGGRAEGEACRSHAQCALASDGRRMRCVGASGRDCDDGTCQPVIEEHGACVHTGMVQGYSNFGDPCDVDAGFRCVAAFDPTAPERRASSTTCELVRYGVLGEPCAASTNYACREPDLACDQRVFECVAAPGSGDPCGAAGAPFCRIDQVLACDGTTCVALTARAAGEACNPGDYCPRPITDCPASGVCPSDPAPGGTCTVDDDCAYYERCADGTCEVLVRPACE